MKKIARARTGATVNVAGESPVSWHVKYQTDGFEQNLILRGSDTSEVLDRSAAAVAWLKERGAEPWAGYGRSNGSKSSDGSETKICPIHSVPMEKYSNDRGSWFSHKAFKPDGSEFWCKGKESGGEK